MLYYIMSSRFIIVMTLGGIVSSTVSDGGSYVMKGLNFVVLALYVQFSFLSFASIGVRPDSFYNYPPAQYSLLFTPKVHAALHSLSSQRRVQVLHVSSSYGLFRQMTGKGIPEPGQRGVGGAPPSVVAR